MFVITADSSPVYYFQSGPSWGCTDFQTWYYAMKTAYGQPYAQKTFLQGWNAQSDASPNVLSCSFSSSFQTFVDSENLPIGTLLSEAVSGGTKTGTSAVNAAAGAAQGVNNIVQTLAIAIPIILIVVIAMVLFTGFENRGKIVNKVTS